MQSQSRITKSPTRIDTYYTTGKGTLIVNGQTNEMTVVLSSSDTIFGVTSLDFGLNEIGFDKNAQTNFETLSWV